MCGIAGFVGSRASEEEATGRILRMTERLAHRGPDGQGVFMAAGVGLGMRRLSIIDLQTGDQPIGNEDGTVQVVLNGEIYNYRSLRRELEGRGHVFSTTTDTEVILHLVAQSKRGRFIERYIEALRAIEGAYALVSLTNKKLALTPWADGRQYVTTEWNVAGAYTDVTVVDRTSGATLHALRVDGYVRGALPSPADKKLVKIIVGASSTSSFSELILDLDTRQARRQIAAEDWFAWMPDGRFLLVNPDAGTIKVGSVDSADTTTLGQFRLPQDRRMGPIWVSPNGKQFVVRLPHATAMGEADLWIANIDGSALEQLTDSKMSFEAQWSPDGRLIAYDTDSSRACTGTVCGGTCQLWYTTPDLRKVRGQSGQAGSSSFRVNDRNGAAATPLGCRLVGWTP